MINHFGKLTNPQADTLPIGQQIRNLFALGGYYYDFNFFFNNDSVNAGNALTLVNSPTRDSLDGRPADGSFVLVAASVQYGTLADNASLRSNPSGFTWGGWFNLASGGGFRRILSKGNVSAPATHEYALNYNNGNRMQASVGNGSGAVVTVTDTQVLVGVATWTYVIARCIPGAGILEISVNRQPFVQAAFAGSLFQGVLPLFVGADSSLGTRCWDGKLDGVFMVPAVLSNAMCDYLYNSGAGRKYSDI